MNHLAGIELPRRVYLAFVGLCWLFGGCAPYGANPGMVTRLPRPDATNPALDELARADPPPAHRALLVVYRRTSCSGSARTVFVDDKGTFLGAVAPGDGALLIVPTKARSIHALSSVDVTANVGAWFAVDDLPGDSLPSGLLLRSRSVDARRCGGGQYADVTPASKAELEATLAETELRWMQPSVPAGQAWLSEHRQRVDEVLVDGHAPTRPVVTRVHVP
jgi:hypothetical protein